MLITLLLAERRPFRRVQISAARLYDYSVENGDRGNVSDEYFLTEDIAEISKGFDRILSGSIKSFSYSGKWPYKSEVKGPYYTFDVHGKDDMVSLVFRIFEWEIEFDCDYQTYMGKLSAKQFEEIAAEFRQAAKLFPIV